MPLRRFILEEEGGVEPPWLSPRSGVQGQSQPTSQLLPNLAESRGFEPLKPFYRFARLATECHQPDSANSPKSYGRLDRGYAPTPRCQIHPSSGHGLITHRGRGLFSQQPNLGAAGRTRTVTEFLQPVFETGGSTDSPTAANSGAGEGI